MTGIKYDENKPPMALLDPEYLIGVSNVLGFGADKYTVGDKSGAHNWRGGIKFSRLISASLRHISAINAGEDIDIDSGLSHAYHLGCCSMFLASMMNHRPDMDDRYKGNTNAIKPNVDNPRTMAVRDIWEMDGRKDTSIALKGQGNQYQAFPESSIAGLYANSYVEPKCNAGSNGSHVGGTGAMHGGYRTDYDPACWLTSTPWMSLQEAMEQFNAKTRMDNALHIS